MIPVFVGVLIFTFSVANAGCDLVAPIPRRREDREISRNVSNLVKVLKKAPLQRPDGTQQVDVERLETSYMWRLTRKGLSTIRRVEASKEAVVVMSTAPFSLLLLALTLLE